MLSLVLSSQSFVLFLLITINCSNRSSSPPRCGGSNEDRLES
jgi:hypothetical protein